MATRIALSAIASMLLVGLVPTTVLASGTSTYSLQTSGSNINIYETSTVAVNTVEADLTYTGLDTISSIGVAIGGTFNTCTSQTSTSIVCTALGGTITGTHLVATLSFSVKNSAADATATAGIVDSSMILASSDSSDTLDHSSLPSATYHYAAPAPVSPPKTSQGASRQTTSVSTTPNSQVLTPAQSGQTLADTSSKAAIAVDKSATKLAGMGWFNTTMVVALLAALIAFTAAAANWFAAYSVHVTVVPKMKSRKHQTKKAIRKPAKRSKK